MHINKTIVLVLIAFTAIFNCGLFTAEDPENPQGKEDVDFLSFKKILDNSVVHFDFEDYEYLFHEDFTYIDPAFISHNRAKLLSRLETIEAKYVDGSGEDTIQVIWFLADSTSSDPEWFDKEKVITLQPRGYNIFLDSLQIDTAYTGEATFKLRYHNLKEEWVISYWRDIPKGGADKSFFHPYFIE